MFFEASEVLINKESEKCSTTEKFQNLIKRHEAAAAAGEVPVPSLYVYPVPEDKNSENYEEGKRKRLEELEGICKQGPSNFCRAVILTHPTCRLGSIQF